MLSSGGEPVPTVHQGDGPSSVTTSVRPGASPSSCERSQKKGKGGKEGKGAKEGKGGKGGKEGKGASELWQV